MRRDATAAPSSDIAGKVDTWMRLLELDHAMLEQLARLEPPSTVGAAGQTIESYSADLVQTSVSVVRYFGGDVEKAARWFRAKNPLLGDVSALQMIHAGRLGRLKRFVRAALDESL